MCPHDAAYPVLVPVEARIAAARPRLDSASAAGGSWRSDFRVAASRDQLMSSTLILVSASWTRSPSILSSA